jgi:hypothetical protein
MGLIGIHWGEGRRERRLSFFFPFPSPNFFSSGWLRTSGRFFNPTDRLETILPSADCKSRESAEAAGSEA